MTFIGAVKTMRTTVNLKGVSAQRNQELVKYQQAVKLNRAKLIEKFKGQETDSQREDRLKKEKAAKEEAEWNKWLAELRAAYADPKHPLSSDRHPCRPKIDYGKTLEERQANWKAHWDSLHRVRVMRRKYAMVLAQEMQGQPGSLQPTGWINRGNLEARIQWALEHPVNYNVMPERLIEEEEALCQRLRDCWVADEEGRMPAPEQFKVKSK